MTQQLTDESTEIIARPVTTDEGDHERFSHYVTKTDLEDAILLGTPAVALCGKRWLPQKDPTRFPVCPECKKVWESLPNNPT